MAQLGADVNLPNEVGRISVHVAAGKGHTEAINTLAGLGANVNTPDNHGRTPAHEGSH